MIEGKDVYQAGRSHLEEMGFEGLEWEDFVPGAQDFYLKIAETLNAQFLAPLITDLGKLKADFHRLQSLDREISIDQDREISSRQALLKEQQRILATMPDVAVWSCDYAIFANWQAQKDALEAHIQALLGEEK